MKHLPCDYDYYWLTSRCVLVADVGGYISETKHYGPTVTMEYY